MGAFLGKPCEVVTGISDKSLVHVEAISGDVPWGLLGEVVQSSWVLGRFLDVLLGDVLGDTGETNFEIL